MGYTPTQLEIRKITGGWSAYGPSSTTTDDLLLYANTADGTPYIKINGTQNVMVYAPNNGTQFFISSTLGNHLLITYTTPDQIIECAIADKNIYLKPTATGYIKLGGLSGTYDATPALASSGFMPILDSAGNVRKVMIQA